MVKQRRRPPGRRLFCGGNGIFCVYLRKIRAMNTFSSTLNIGNFHPQFIKDTVGNHLVVLPQNEFEVLLNEQSREADAHLSLAEILKKESKAVAASSVEVLREFEAIEI
jgi:hypothetical protein